MRLSGKSCVKEIEHSEILELKSRTGIRYADKAAWLVAKAIGLANSEPEVNPDEVGVIIVSDSTTRVTLSELSNGMSRSFLSPLKFSGANPGSLVGVSCIIYGFKGPTLNFIMPPEVALLTVIPIASIWLKDAQASKVFICMVNNKSIAKCMELSSDSESDPLIYQRAKEILEE